MHFLRCYLRRYERAQRIQGLILSLAPTVIDMRVKIEFFDSLRATKSPFSLKRFL